MRSQPGNVNGLKRSSLKSKSGRKRLLIFAPNGEKYRTPLQQERPEFWVYELVDKRACIYVGMTSDPIRRMYAHRHVGTAPKSAVMQLVKRCENWVEASHEEVALIQKRQPPGNIHYNGRMPNDEAYEVWKRVDQPAHWRLSQMPGWNQGTADYAFTRRLIEDGLKSV